MRPPLDLRTISWIVAVILFNIILAAACNVRAADSSLATIDLTHAVVVIPADLSPREMKAVSMLVEEVAKRSQIQWPVSQEWPKSAQLPVIAVGRDDNLRRDFVHLATWLNRVAAPSGAEGYRVQAEAESTVLVVGNDARGVLFGVGRLLRELRMSRGEILLPADFEEASSPQLSLRGHQLGYRPKTNSYDGWDLLQWEQYYRDLAVFGTNAIELIPPRSDDDADSPHFPAAPLETMIGMSRLADEYGLDVWVWYPAMDKDYTDPATVEFALKEWEVVYRSLSKIDNLFVPGGDPGHTPPAVLMNLLEKQTQLLHRYHPQAQMWVSPQGFSKAWLDEFIEILVNEDPQWLAGLVFGPQQFASLKELRAMVPSRYPIRGYPDITHSVACQHPVPDWDAAFAITQEREVINPRPLDQAAIFNSYQNDTIGFLSYSEGCNDDVNKIIWSGLGWNPQVKVDEILRQYGRYFVGPRHEEGIAQGLLALERNWRGPLLTNSGVDITMAQFQNMERSATPADLRNWRFQQLLYRAYYDAFLRDRLIAETSQQTRAFEILRQAKRIGTGPSLDQAQAVLSQAVLEPTSEDRRTRINELAEALFQSVHMQLDSQRYLGQKGRGTTQDTLDLPLNDRFWLQPQFDSIRQLGSEQERIAAIDEILNRTDPGPGGFYDDLGDPSNQTHLVRGIGFERDPDYRRSTWMGCDGFRLDWPRAWITYAMSMYDSPLTMHYQSLNPRATYRLRVTYAQDRQSQIRLDAEGHEIHPLIAKPDVEQPLEFDIPAQLTADGELTLQWHREAGRGGNGRGCQVREVWLMETASNE
ncbi:MAG: hypothetical protein ABI557_02720 [Aureliella sp.]